MAKCFKKGCETATEEGSNYCAAHLPAQMTAKKVLKSDSGLALEPKLPAPSSAPTALPGIRRPPKP